MYTVILILTCLVASPFIFKQIWESSSVKKPKAEKKEPVISTILTTAEPAPTEEKTTETVAAEEGQTEEQSEEPTETDVTEETTTTEKPSSAESADFDASTADYFDEALFIGDSRTVGIKEYGTLKNADYFCSVGLASYKAATEYIDGYTLTDKLTSNEYGKIYIMLGINEVAMDIEYTITQFRTLLETVQKYQPDAVVYLQGNLHVTEAAQTQNITNDGINLLNSRLSQLADENDNVYFIDINEVFDDETGALTPDFTSDGIHVLGRYYEVWCEWLCQHTVADSSSKTATTTAAATTTGNYTETTAAQQYYYDNSYDDYNSYDNNNYYGNDYNNSYNDYDEY